MRIMDVLFKAGILAALTAHLHLYSQDIGSQRYQATDGLFVLDSQRGVMYYTEPDIIGILGETEAWSVLTGEKIKPEPGRHLLFPREDGSPVDNSKKNRHRE